MSQLEKEKDRIRSIPKDYTYSEAKSLLKKLGYTEFKKGKTSGSRVKFYREDDKNSISLHKPHPSNVMSRGSVRDLVKHLQDLGEL